MAEITAALVKELRERSGVGMMDCKKALVENDGNIEAAIDWLRAKGLSKAAKKADRVAAEGLVAVASKEDGKGEVAAAIEFNAETDFVARNELFQNAAKSFAQLGLDHHTVEALHGAELEAGKTVQDEVTNMIATIGENMQLRRAARLSVSEGVVSTYVHNAVSPGVGRIGVLVALEGEGDKTALRELGRKIAMHVALLPGREQPLHSLGLALKAAGRQAEAAQALRQAAALAPAHGGIWFELALVLQDLRDFEGAADALRQVLRVSPPRAEVEVNLGIVLQEAGRMDEAMQAYGRAYRLNGDTFGRIAHALATAPTGRLWLDLEDLRAALLLAAPA